MKLFLLNNIIKKMNESSILLILKDFIYNGGVYNPDTVKTIDIVTDINYPEVHILYINKNIVCHFAIMTLHDMEQDIKYNLLTLQQWKIFIVDYLDFIIENMKHEFVRPTKPIILNMIARQQWDELEDMIDFDLLVDEIIVDAQLTPQTYDRIWIYKENVLMLYF